MKKVRRECIWETNSSTSHSCVMMTKEQSDKWESSDLYYYQKSGWWDAFKDLKDLPEGQRPINQHFYTLDEVLYFLELINCKFIPEEWKDYDKDYAIRMFIEECDCGFLSYGMWEEIELEVDYTEYTTPNGETVVAYCKYGNNY